MNRQRRMRTLAVLLVIGMLLSWMPAGVISLPAQATTDAHNAAAELSASAFQLDADCQLLQYVDEAVFAAGNHVARLKEKETLSTYVFLNVDGTQTVYYMDENVKFVDSTGTVREKNISLTATRSGFSTTSNDVALSLPSDLSKGIALSYGGYDVTMIPENISTATVQQQDGKVTYLNCYGKGTGLIYTPTLSGLKEDILLSAYTGVNSFSFLLNTDGLRPYTDEQGRYYFAQSANAEFKLELADIVAYDANARFSLGSVTITPITMGQQYRLTVTVSEEFLTAEATAYPVLIDPTITVSDSTHGDGAIEDATVYSGQPNLNTGTWTYNHVGYHDATYGTGRVVYRLTGLLNSGIYQRILASQIESAFFHLTEASGSDYAVVNLYPLDSNSTWTETNVTWNNMGTYVNTLQEYKAMGYNETSVFNITYMVKQWKTGGYNANSGFVLMRDPESGPSKGLLGSEYGVADKRPCVVVTYTDPNAYETVNEGATATLSAEGLPGPILWQSTNTAVVTVTTSGTIQGIKAGQASIVASVNGVIVKTFVVYVTIPDGQYLIKANSGAYYLTPTKIQNWTGSKLQTSKRADAYADQIVKLSQIWNIKHIGKGHYTISAIYEDGLNISLLSDNTLTISGTAAENRQKWNIVYDGVGYQFIDYLTESLALASKANNGGFSHGTLIGVRSLSENSNTMRWQLVPQQAEGLMLLDYYSGERMDTEACVAVAVDPPSGTRTYTLDELELEVKIFDSTNSGTALTWTSSNTNVATVNSTTGAVTVKAKGGAIITAHRTINNMPHIVSHKISVISSTDDIDIVYDEKYIEKHPDAISKLNEYAYDIQRIFLFYLEKEITFSAPQQFTSLPDTCPTLGDDDRCNCELIYGYLNCSHIHSNLGNILDSIVKPSSNNCVAFIGHDTCYDKSGRHDFNTAYGLANYRGTKACVAASDESPERELSTAVHEIGHLYGAPDHYGRDTPTTDDLNNLVSGSPFSNQCIYGSQKDTVSPSTICDGCVGVMRGTIILP